MSPPEPSYYAKLRQAIGSAPWCIDHVHVEDGRLSAAGWAVPIDGKIENTHFRINGAAPDDATVGMDRSDILNMYGYVDNARLSGFSISGPITPGEQAVEISRVDRHGNTIDPYQSYFVSLGQEKFPVPSTEHRTRTGGDTSEMTFLYGGYTLFRKLDLVSRRELNRPLSSYKSILDWGAGCGRLSRYFIGDDFSGAALTMADIDADNVEWCRTHLPAGRAFQLPLMPPSGLADESFDLIVGNSVFTHLREDAQFAWLEELQRLMLPGGTALVTIHNVKDMMGATHAEEAFAQLFASGFIDSFPDSALDGYIEDKDYYRATFHTHEYVYSRWSQYFSVVKIITNFGNNRQDLVILRKR